MNRVAHRATITLLLALVLLLGMAFFVVEYFFQAGNWVVFAGSPHVYNAGNIGTGTVTDRDGEVLLAMTTNDRAYGEERLLRQATLHWLGDREGNISAPAVTHYADAMVGFNVVNGVYSYSGSGGTARLTLSARIQETALEALDGRKGTVAVYNYKTGELLCAVTSPTYDPDDVPENMDGDRDYEGVYLNRFTQAAYVPGSIFKVVSAGAALETMPQMRTEIFHCSGEYEVGQTTVTCENAHGDVDLGRALTVSCNCYFANLARKLGADVLEDYVEQFGVTKSVTFDGITTQEGSFDPTGGDAELAWSAIGQHRDTVNPCTFLTFMGAIANGGRGAVPYVVGDVHVGRRATYTAKTGYTDTIMTASTAEMLQEYLRDNVINNYGDDNFPGLSVCAKSGTAEVGGDRAPNAMFAGFLQDEAYPLAFVVMVENGGYGSHVCVPILSQVLAACKDVMDGN